MIKSIKYYGFPKAKGAGDVMHSIVKPFARAIGSDCIDPKTGELKPDSRCGKSVAKLNEQFPAKK